MKAISFSAKISRPEYERAKNLVSGRYLLFCIHACIRTKNLQCPGRSSQKPERIQTSVNDAIYVSKRNILL